MTYSQPERSLHGDAWEAPADIIYGIGRTGVVEKNNSLAFPKVCTATMGMMQVSSPRSMFVLGLLAAVAERIGASPCPNLCSGHGHCSEPDRVCRCFDGWIGGDCSLLQCPFGRAWTDEAQGVDDAHNLAECSNRGLCDRETGVCVCEEERFEGAACERKSCPSNCNNRGRCLSMGYYASFKDAGEGPVYKYGDVWDANLLYGCVCDEGFFGPDCSLRDCPRGDDPLTGTTADPDGSQSNERQLLRCRATGGTFTLTFRGETTEPISYGASVAEFQESFEKLTTISSQFGEQATEILFADDEACTASGNQVVIEFKQDFGDVPLVLADSSRLEMSIATSSVILDVGHIKQGTKENSYCSDRGICTYTTGVCTCAEGYDTSNGYNSKGTRGDCGYVTESITACPGETSCSGHGVCSGSPTYECACSNGFMGADCSLMQCPSGKSWFTLPTLDEEAHLELTECSDMGTCDRTTGTCACSAGFEGGACDTMSCPGDPACNGHGQCMTMSALALVANVNGDAAGYTYGATPNEPSTWDFDMVQGCYCDDGYAGFDCSLNVCPYGDDPLTKHFQYNEIQEFSCDTNGASSGTFTLTFRQETTVLIPVTATADDVRKALEDLPTVTTAKVYTDIGIGKAITDDICSEAGTDFYVEFLYPTGDVPMITIDAVGPEMLNKEYVKGSKEFDECSNRGLCDRATGLCSCFEGFSASDGQGNDGTIANCGYQEPIIGAGEE